jgi:hypothetical protein
MNDDNLIAALRQQRTTVPMTIPVEHVISRGRTLRARRRVPALAGVLAVAGAGAFAATALPASGPPSGAGSGTQLAAWTVSKQVDGTISVTIRQLTDPAGLQRILRADGVPAYVTFRGSPSCQPMDGVSKDQLRAVYQLQPSDPGTVLTIHPAALPTGAGVLIYTGYGQGQGGGAAKPGAPAANPAVGGPAKDARGLSIQAGLVKTSEQCTGS